MQGILRREGDGVEKKIELVPLLLDTLNTALEDQFFVRAQIKQYLKSAQGGTRIAIFGLARHLYLLQGFTSNTEILRAAVDRKGSSKSSPLLDDPVGKIDAAGLNADEYGIFEIEMMFQHLVAQTLYGDVQLLFVQDRLHFIKIGKKEETSVAGLPLQTIQTFFKTLKQTIFYCSCLHRTDRIHRSGKQCSCCCRRRIP